MSKQKEISFLRFRLIKLFTNILALRFRSSEERKEYREKCLKPYSKVSFEYYRAKNAFTRGRDLGSAMAGGYGNSDYEIETASAMQNLTFPVKVVQAEKLMVLLLPEHDAMSGGIYSIFSITNHLRRMRADHGYEIVLMTRPNQNGDTYFRNSWFKNSENVYRFEQVQLCTKVKDLYLHIPEYASAEFYAELDDELKSYLKSVDQLSINLLDQNIQLMPEKELFEDLYKLTENVTQSVAHHSYAGQDFANKYGLPTLLLPAYTDLTPYPKSQIAHKQDIIIYSLDEAPHKAEVLSILERELPSFEFIEIRDISFDDFMELATNCKFSITFGEGFDGYLAQPIYQGGIGFSVYNEEFFPSHSFKQYPNIFESSSGMCEQIVNTIKELLAQPKNYEELNCKLVAEYDKLYSEEEYIDKIRMLAKQQFEVFPEVSQ
ncbi:hypothetical protein [Rubritalea marina]|uniref:hypothetical protein n=1 Tax=Rubritalea marina TaxID=361055 RepID=UPI00037571ED|nr:hypothetical protein [Rubritalea marina]